MKSAAQRAGSVSSAPAFFTAHLKRRFSGQRAGESEHEQGGRSRSAETARKNKNSETDRRKKTEVGGEEKSVFSFEERVAYAEAQEPKLGPGWLKESEAGSYDKLISYWVKKKNAENPKTVVNLSLCPDCAGTGFTYPDGFERGAKKCAHPKLKAE